MEFKLLSHWKYFTAKGWSLICKIFQDKSRLYQWSKVVLLTYFKQKTFKLLWLIRKLTVQMKQSVPLYLDRILNTEHYSSVMWGFEQALSFMQFEWLVLFKWVVLCRTCKISHISNPRLYKALTCDLKSVFCEGFFKAVSKGTVFMQSHLSIFPHHLGKGMVTNHWPISVSFHRRLEISKPI